MIEINDPYCKQLVLEIEKMYYLFWEPKYITSNEIIYGWRNKEIENHVEILKNIFNFYYKEYNSLSTKLDMERLK